MEGMTEIEYLKTLRDNLSRRIEQLEREAPKEEEWVEPERPRPVYGMGNVKSPINELQEGAMRNEWTMPKYVELERDGPDHNPVFKYSATNSREGREFGAIGTGSTKKIAKDQAAHNLWLMLT